MNGQVVLRLPHGANNPRNSEGAFMTITDGRIMFAYTHFCGRDWADNAAAVIAARYSADGGRTWSGQKRVLVTNEGRLNVMSVSLLRLQDGRMALFYLRKNSVLDCRLYLRTSLNEGQTWSRPTPCIAAPGWFVVNNDRVVQLSNGRILVPQRITGHDRMNAATNARRSMDAEFSFSTTVTTAAKPGMSPPTGGPCLGVVPPACRSLVSLN